MQKCVLFQLCLVSLNIQYNVHVLIIVLANKHFLSLFFFSWLGQALVDSGETMKQLADIKDELVCIIVTKFALKKYYRRCHYYY